MYISSRIRDRLLGALEDMEDEIIGEIQVQAEKDDPEAGPYSEEEARRELEFLRNRVTELLDGKTGWLDVAAKPWPSWLLDAQREVAEIVLCRRWIGSLDLMLARLIDVETLVLSEQAPAETRAAMQQAGVCFMYGLIRASAMLARTAIESALRARIQTIGVAVDIDRKDLKSAISAVTQVGCLGASGTAAAHRVRTIGNSAVHRDVAVTERDAENAITAARHALKELYGITSQSPSRR
jgi:hypothetical protein